LKEIVKRIDHGEINSLSFLSLSDLFIYLLLYRGKDRFQCCKGGCSYTSECVEDVSERSS